MTRISNLAVRRRWHGVLTCAVFVAATWSLSGSPGLAAVDKPVDAGDVAVVNADNRSKEIVRGESATAFSVRLPDGARCPGDSANDQWRVQSFLIPSIDDPVDIRYGPIGPDPVGNGRYALFGVDTVPFVHKLTIRNPVPGAPGEIPALPSFSFAVVAGERIPNGSYRIGVACSYFGRTALYWDTEVVISGSGDGSHLSWRLTSAPEHAERSNSRSFRWIIVACIGLIVATVGVFFWRRRGRPTTTLNKESY